MTQTLATDTTPRFTKRQAVRKLWTNVRVLLAGRTYRLWILSVVSILGGFTEAGVLYLVVRIAIALADNQKRVDLGLGPVKGLTLTLAGTLLAAVIAVVVLALLGIVETIISARMSADVLMATRTALFSDFVRASWPVQALEHEGQLQEYMSTYVVRVASSIAIFSGGFIAGFNFLALLASAIAVDPVAAGSSLGGFIIVFFLLRPLNTLSKKASRENATVNAAFSRRMTQSVSLAREIKVFDVGDQLVEEVNELAEEARRTTYITRVLAGAVANVYRNVTLLIVLLGMGVVYALGVSEVSQLGAVVLLLVRSLSYSQTIQSSVQAAAELAPYLEDLEAQQELYREGREARDGRHLGPVEALELQHVDFSYTPGVPVLIDVSLRVERGEVIGIVGPSGSGKSTLVQILLRLRNPDDGVFLVNGEDARDVGLAGWYEQFVFVPQENHLLFASVSDNIRFYRPSLTQEEIERAAARAHLSDEIERFPDRFDTLVGPGGHELSGGQKQRLALARALVGDPSVLVLDEPTSSLDMRSERLVQQTLQELRGKVTLFIVAHRISTLSICDRVLVLRNGRVEGFGRPEDLRRSDGFYRDALQLMGKAESGAGA